MSDSKRAMLAALSGLASRGRRSGIDSKLPEEKRGGLTIIVVGGDESTPESAEQEIEEVPEEAPALELEDEDEDDDEM